MVVYILMASPMLADWTGSRRCYRPAALLSAGSRIAINSAMMPMTTSNSTSVNARLWIPNFVSRLPPELIRFTAGKLHRVKMNLSPASARELKTLQLIRPTWNYYCNCYMTRVCLEIFLKKMCIRIVAAPGGGLAATGGC